MSCTFQGRWAMPMKLKICAPVLGTFDHLNIKWIKLRDIEYTITEKQG